MPHEEGPLWDRCATSTRLVDNEFATLQLLPAAVDPILRSIKCELAAGHSGSHVAFTVAVSGGEHWWWLRWESGLRNLVRADGCVHIREDGPQSDECLLPEDHQGPHSFEIRAVLPKAAERCARPHLRRTGTGTGGRDHRRSSRPRGPVADR
jgi:hypothetical protein